MQMRGTLSARPTVRGVRCVATVTAVLLVTLLVAAAQAPLPAGAVPVTSGGANTDFQFSAQPYAVSGSQQRSYFNFQLEPGHRILDQVAILNKSSAPESFLVYPEDATNVPGTGSYSYQSRDKVHNVGAGKWITVGNTSLTVPAGQAAVVTFQVAPPVDAPPGDHAGAIVVEELHPPTASTPKVGINLVLRFAVPLFLHVVGPLHPSVAIQNLVVTHSNPAFPYLSGGANVAVTFDMVNTGNDILNPQSATVSITGLLSGTVHTYTTRQANVTQSRANPLPIQMLPGARLRLTEVWNGLPPFDPLTANVAVKAVDQTDGLPVTDTASTKFWYFPWIPVLIVLIVIGALIARRRIRRRRADAGGASTDSADSPGDSPQTPPGTPESETMEGAGV